MNNLIRVEFILERCGENGGVVKLIPIKKFRMVIFWSNFNEQTFIKMNNNKLLPILSSPSTLYIATPFPSSSFPPSRRLKGEEKNK